MAILTDHDYMIWANCGMDAAYCLGCGAAPAANMAKRHDGTRDAGRYTLTNTKFTCNVGNIHSTFVHVLLILLSSLQIVRQAADVVYRTSPHVKLFVQKACKTLFTLLASRYWTPLGPLLEFALHSARATPVSDCHVGKAGSVTTMHAAFRTRTPHCVLRKRRHCSMSCAVPSHMHITNCDNSGAAAFPSTSRRFRTRQTLAPPVKQLFSPLSVASMHSYTASPRANTFTGPVLVLPCLSNTDNSRHYSVSNLVANVHILHLSCLRHCHRRT